MSRVSTDFKISVKISIQKYADLRCFSLLGMLEKLVTSPFSSTTLWQVFNKALTTCQQAGNKQCEHILLISCWNSIATSLLQVCYNSCVFTCVVSFIKIDVAIFNMSIPSPAVLQSCQ
jgi:hypothetical protein